MASDFVIRNPAGEYFTGDLNGFNQGAKFSADTDDAIILSDEEARAELGTSYMPPDVTIEEWTG